jgi:hypothetical protein
MTPQSMSPAVDDEDPDQSPVADSNARQKNMEQSRNSAALRAELRGHKPDSKTPAGERAGRK